MSKRLYRSPNEVNIRYLYLQAWLHLKSVPKLESEYNLYHPDWSMWQKFCCSFFQLNGNVLLIRTFFWLAISRNKMNVQGNLTRIISNIKKTAKAAPKARSRNFGCRNYRWSTTPIKINNRFKRRKRLPKEFQLKSPEVWEQEQTLKQPLNGSIFEEESFQSYCS